MESPELVDPEWTNLFRREAEARQTLEEVLARVPAFSLLDSRGLKTLARIVHLRRFAPGEVVIPRGVEQSGFYLIRSGSVHIVRQGPDHLPAVVGTLGPGELLGEFALLDSTPRTSAVVAAERSELIGFFKPDLMDILITDPEMGCKILLRLAEQMSQTLARDYQSLVALGYDFLEDGEEAGYRPAPP